MDAKGTSNLLWDLGRKSCELGLGDCGKALWRAWYLDYTLKVGQDFNRERKMGKDFAVFKQHLQSEIRDFKHCSFYHTRWAVQRQNHRLQSRL